MAIRVGQPFKRTGAFPIDESLVLSKEQMLAVDDNQMPDLYYALCSDDGKFYIYDKTATPSAETGKYVVMEGGSGISDISFIAPPFDSTKAYTAGDVVTYNNKRYVANDDIEAGTFDPADWTEQDVQGAIDAVSGDASMGFDYTTNIAVGGLASGTDIHATDTIASVLKRMLVTTYYPTFVAPSANMTSGVDRLGLVGDLITGDKDTRVTFNPGAIMLNGVKQNDRAGAATKYTLTTSGSIMDKSVENDTGIFNYSDEESPLRYLTRYTPGNITLTSTVEYEAGVQPKDSDGRDYESPLDAGSVSAKSITIEFIYNFYYGANNNLDITFDEVLYANPDLSKKGTKKYTITSDNQHVFIAYDSNYGDLTSILDQNGFESISGFRKKVVSYTSPEGITESYTTYTQETATTDTAEYTFKF